MKEKIDEMKKMITTDKPSANDLLQGKIRAVLLTVNFYKSRLRKKSLKILLNLPDNFFPSMVQLKNKVEETERLWKKQRLWLEN